MKTRKNDPKRLTITLVGAAGVGKSSFMSKLIGRDLEDKYDPTVGVGFESLNKSEADQNGLNTMMVPFPDGLDKVCIWDIGGQERAFEKSYVDFANIVMICFDANTGNGLNEIIQMVYNCADLNPTASIYIVPLKSDLPSYDNSAHLTQFEALCKDPSNHVTFLNPFSAKTMSTKELQQRLVDEMIVPHFSNHPTESVLVSKFIDMRARLKKEAADTFSFFRPAFISRSHINPTSSLHDILLAALHSETNVARKACIKLNWLDEAGALDAYAPMAVKSAFDEANKKKMTTNFLGWETVTLKANG